MQHNDVVLKEMFQNAVQAITELGGSPVVRWLNVDMAQVKALRPDLVGQLRDGRLFHLELMTKNEPLAPARMLEYNVTIQIGYRQVPDQVLLYVGYDAMRMADRIETPNLTFRFRLVDARVLDGEALLESPALGDNILAVLGRLRNERAAVREILERIGKCTPVEREKSLTALMTMAGLRRLASLVEEETKRMPLHIDILENEVLGREYRKGLALGMEQGLEKGLEKGLERGREEGERKALVRLAEMRFGPISAVNAQRFASMTTAEVEQALARIFHCTALDDLLR